MTRARLIRLLVSALVVAGLSTLPPALAAQATEYPTWGDVQNAKQSEQDTADAIARIQGLRAQLQQEEEAATAEANRLGTIFKDAQDKADAAAETLRTLTAQADQAQQDADTAAKEMSRLASALYRSGGETLTMRLLFDPSVDQKDLLTAMGSATQVASHIQTLSEQAQAKKNQATSLGKQATIASKEHARLADEAKTAFTAAADAQKAARDKLEVNHDQAAVLEAQLAALKDTTARTVAAYEQGVTYRQEQAAANGGYVSDAGWARPGPGYVSDWYGPREPVWTPNGWSSSYHRGIDLSQSCGSPIFAMTAGLVSYAGWYGGYGNAIIIDHGQGITTTYAHIASGGTLVDMGSFVDTGQQIAMTGSTGNSTGCHLHFEIRQDGEAFDPAPFLADRGITF